MILVAPTVDIRVRIPDEVIHELIVRIASQFHPKRIILFGSYAKKTFQEDSDIDLFYQGQITDKEIETVKNIGKIYGKTINIKKSTLKKFESGLRGKDPLIIEIIKNHIILQNPEQFINSLWRYYDEKR